MVILVQNLPFQCLPIQCSVYEHLQWKGSIFILDLHCSCATPVSCYQIEQIMYLAIFKLLASALLMLLLVSSSMICAARRNVTSGPFPSFFTFLSRSGVGLIIWILADNPFFQGHVVLHRNKSCVGNNKRMLCNIMTTTRCWLVGADLRAICDCPQLLY